MTTELTQTPLKQIKVINNLHNNIKHRTGKYQFIMNLPRNKPISKVATSSRKVGDAVPPAIDVDEDEIPFNEVQ